MKEFNLEEAKAGKPVCTRDGHEARIVCFDVKSTIYSILALVTFDKQECEIRYYSNGRNVYGLEESNLDLMMVGEKKNNMWIARDENGNLCIFPNKPIKNVKEGCWGSEDFAFVEDDNLDMFPDIKWSDKEPREIIIKSKEE